MSQAERYSGQRIFASILWSLLGLAMVVLLGAAMSLKHNKRCKGVDINISGVQNNFFIDKNEISNILQQLSGGPLIGKTLGSFNLAAIENTLRKNQWIKNAELFFDNNEVLRVEVTEREPLARIFTHTGSSFYLDSTLTSLPLSDRSSARVPVFSNFPAQQHSLTKEDSILLKDVKNISSYILSDPFWMAQVDQVDITPERTFVIVPKVGNQVIIFGKADNYEEKFKNLLTFYKQVATKVGWNTYSQINVQYKNQVVAVKRGTEDVIQDLLRTKQIMESIAANALKQSGDSIKNIQLVQQQDENVIPLAPRLEDIHDEQPMTVTPDPVVANPVETVPSSTEKPDPILSTKPVAKKNAATEKKVFKPIGKPFWLQAAATKPKTSNVLKRSTTKSKFQSHEKPNPIPSKNKVVLKSATKQVDKSATKTITKPIIKPATKTKPKAVMPPPNDY